MTSFDFVFGLISVITSLALTQLLSGMVALYRCADRLRLSWRHAFWTAKAFMLLIGNWSAMRGMRSIQAWGVPDVLIDTASAATLTAVAAVFMVLKLHVLAA